VIVGLTLAVLALALAWALWCAVSAAVGQAPTIRHRIGLLVLEAVALVQALVLVVGLVVAPGRSGGAVVEIVGYLIATLVVLPIGAALAHGERTRYGSVVLAVAGVTLAVLSLRTGQVWTVTRA
jgi:hypothetical protein